MDFEKTLELSGNKLPKSSTPVHWHNLDSIPASLLESKVISIVYVDDIIFWSKNTADIDSSVIQLRELGVDLKQEDDATEFLGVTLECNLKTNLLEIKQTGLMKRVIKALGLDDEIVKEKYTPSESKPLVKNLHGEAARTEQNNLEN
jgi:hypothetical protein